MPQERSDMRRVKEVLRLAHELGYSLRQTSRSVRLCSTSVRNYLARAEAAGVRYEDIASKSEAEIEALLFTQPELPASRPQPDWAAVATELRKPAVTLLLVWQEYRDQHPDGYSYSQFRRRYREHLHLAAPEPRMRRTLLPAEMCEVDYAGMTMPVATADGVRQVSIFVGTLPFSTIIYAEATWTQTTEDWLGSHVRMFNAWGGSVPTGPGQSEDGRHPRQLLRYSVLYTRLSRLLDDLAVARLGNGVGRLMRQVTRVGVLILDDWAMIDLTAAQRRDLMEIVDDRHDRGSIILASQLPVDRWHATIGDPTYADAILDRLVHNAIRLPLKGKSLREPEADAGVNAECDATS